MQFFKSILVCTTTLLAFALAADLKITSAPSAVQGGSSYTIEWTGGDGSPATILLRKGASNDLKTVATLTTSGTGGKFTWNVDNSLVTDNDYAIQITEGTETNYWAVSVAADGTASASSSTASSTASSSGSSSASSSKSSMTSASHTSSSVSASITSTRNSTTISSATLKSSKTSSGSSTESTASSTTSSSSSSSSAAAAAPSSGSNNLKSNAALVLGAVAAIAYLG